MVVDVYAGESVAGSHNHIDLCMLGSDGPLVVQVSTLGFLFSRSVPVPFLNMNDSFQSYHLFLPSSFFIDLSFIPFLPVLLAVTTAPSF